MNKPALVILAAGIGSRFGGLKQVAPVDSFGRAIIDYSIYDAKRAGFETAICVINPAQEREFREMIGDRLARLIDVRYAYQRLDALPAGFSVPEGRNKPWGTAHAVLAAKSLIDGPFAVVNADDFYGASSYKQMFGALQGGVDASHGVLVAFLLENTLTEHGYVSRGVCEANEAGNLISITERVHIERRPNGAMFIDEDGAERFLPNGTVVSMNLWGFDRGFVDGIEERFARFLADNLSVNPLKCEFYLPSVVDAMLKGGAYKVGVQLTEEKWLGVTYANDLPAVKSSIAQLISAGVYPEGSWGEQDG